MVMQDFLTACYEENMAKDMLLEIGTEEIPARFMSAAMTALKESAERHLKENRVGFGEVIVYGTPRRLVLIVKGLSELQEDIATEVLGPPKNAAYDREGNPTKAAAGFARGQGVDVSALRIKNTDRGEYVYVERHEQGRRTQEILPAILEDLLASVTFPKSMRWNDTRVRFARPVRWILALLSGDLIPFRFAGLESGRVSYGHRLMSPGTIRIERVEDYIGELEKNFVIVDQTRRQILVIEQIQEIVREKGGRVIGDEELLEEITFLTEYPLAVCGGFDKTFLTLPRDVLITVMKEHQRCFSIEGQAGKILPYFIAVSNTVPKDLDVVRNGYERVIRARLSDAKFFFDEDGRKRLEEHAEKLRQVVFMGGLGTMWDKVQRLRELSGRLCQALGCPEITAIAERAAQLSKADLMTAMVGEFPELQGVMGKEYAGRQGEAIFISGAIFEHYLPRFSGDLLPTSQAGKVLAIADKIDNITGCFGTGNIPSGSYDPYALRRQALGIHNILITGRYFVSLSEIVRMSLSAYGDKIEKGRHPEIIAGVMEFFKERLNTFLVTEEYRYDCVRAVLSAGLDDPYDSYLRISALDRFRRGPEFESLIISFKRVMNIIPPGLTGEMREYLFREDEEKGLYKVYRVIREKADSARGHRDYEKAFASIAELKPHVDLFFDKVLVMDKDMNLRNNRLLLLNELKSLFLTLADFTQIVVG